MSKILIIDDDNSLAETVKDVLCSSGYVVDIANSAEEAEEMLSFPYNLYIIDWTMPGKQGIDVVRKVRANASKVPILMLTGLSSIEHKTVGLETGADDYLTKPFDSKELVARVRALLRRPLTFEDDELNLADVKLNTRTLKVSWKGSDLKLTKLEFQVLELLMRNKDRVFSHDALIQNVWSSLSESSTDTVRVHMARLRKKFSDSMGTCPIRTVHGQGYVFVTDTTA